ncbi:hypothetical protein OS493_013731 [Desmophyllum pertusum]|uniref:Uncharacterized protein n=1 Tax=Desmophyllum pertusum TaxID=174260 RepID=A0A9W9ZPS3_9CNID|nr:hypothetical protein OS493_013731 [Desmophyllum pertusum]
MGCRAITKGRRAISYCILTAYERALEKFGFFLAHRPLIVLLVWLIIVIASCLGFIRLRVEKPSNERFSATDSQSRQDMRRAAQFFPLLEARQEQFIMIPKHGQNILSEECLKEAILVHQAIVNISGYGEICSKQPPSNTRKKLVKRECVVSSPLELAGTHFEHFSNFSYILGHELKNSTIVLSTGQTFNSSVKKMLSNFQVKSKTDSLTVQANALRVIYFIRETTSEEDDQAILNFEKSFASVLSSMVHRLKCASLSFNTEKTTNDALQNILKPELKPLYLSALTMVLLVFCVIYLSSNSLSCLTTVVLIIAAIIVPFACTAGIISMVDSPLFPTTLFIPFLLLGKATSDVVLIVGEWEEHQVPSLEHRVSNCVTRTGFVAALPALCGAILFGITIKSSFDVVSEFFSVALVAFTLVSFASFTVTVILLMYFERRLNKLNTSCLWRCSRRSAFTNFGILQEVSIQQLKDKLRHFREAFAQILTSTAGKILSLVIFVGIITLCVLSALQPNERTSTTASLYQNDNFKQFSEAQQKFFGNEIDTSIVFSEEIDYSQETVQLETINICKMLQEASYSEGKSLCWIAALRQWAKVRNMSCLNSDFYRCLNLFLNQSHHVPYRQDLCFEDENLRPRILVSRVHLRMVLHNRFREDSGSLEELREDLSTQSSLEAAPVSETFLDLDDLFLLERDTVFVLIIATAVVFALSLISSSSLRISIYLAITFDVIVLEAACMMGTWEIHLNHISFLALFMPVILSLHFNIQLAHSFVFSTKQSVRDRMIEALSAVVWPVLIAAFIAISGSFSLGFTYPSLADIFNRLIPLVLALGLIHALFILPPIIILFVEFVDSLNFQIEVGTHVLLTQKEINEGIPLQLQVGQLRQLKSKRPGISIVGINCRFPGASSKDLFWDLLEKGKSSIGAFPQNRIEEHKAFFQLYHPKRFVSGRLCAVNGSFLEEIQNFDNRFFGISNQEARGMDPQQRILLQVVYEAIEDAGMRLEDLQMCRTGVFVGVMNLEYGALLTNSSNYNNIDQFSATGMTASILANRVSFCLNLTGPSIAVDTACSSSLTALKLACDNLYNEDCEMAIVCAPNIVLSHAMQMVSSMAGLLAPDGRCKSFDASGDGYGRGEGFAAVILKLSNAARSDKDDVYCEIIACGMNNDGQNAVPMTAPSAKMQAELSQMVLEQSGVAPEDVDYFEAHGTGTAIGDVVEVTSIADTYTRDTEKRTQTLRVGSVKSNLNHTESTSGLAGLIKVALMIKNKRLVPTVNVQVLNPKLKLEEKGLIVQQTSEPWNTETGKPRIGAVNSFGYGGSNVHVILREVTSKQSLHEKSINRQNNVLTISARSTEALQKMARHYSEWLKDHVNELDEPFVENLCYSLNQRRSQLPHRLALSFGSTAEASESLADYGNDSVGWDKLVSYGEVNSTNPKLVFMFGGQGSQWYAMGRQLIETEDVFREAILTVSNVLKDLGNGWSLVDELMAPEDKSRIAENCIAQPATFAVQYATSRLLMSWRIYPSAVIGHSLGEFAAACVAGIITVKEAVQLVLTRSTLQDKCPNTGGMAALGISEEKARTLLTELKLSATLDIAAVNDAKSVTVSGDVESIEALGQHLTMHAKGTFWRVLGTKRAFHSSHMEGIKKPFHAAMKSVKLNPQLSKIPMYSTVAGEVLSGQQFNSDYWWRNIRCPVQFYSSMKHLLKDGYKQIIEISTQPILAHYVKQIALQDNLKGQETPVVVETLPRKRVLVKDQHKCFLQNTLKMTDPYSGLHCWETEIDLHRFPNLKDHALIQGGTVMPGAAYLEMAFAMVKDTFVDIAGFELCDVKLLSLLTLPETQVRSLRLRLLKNDKIDEATFHITSVQDDQSEIKLSSGSVSLDLLHRQDNCDEGTTIRI